MGDVSNMQMGIECLLSQKKVELTKYGRKQAARKLLSSCVVVGWQGRSEGCVLGRGRDSTYYLVDCALSQAYNAPI